MAGQLAQARGGSELAAAIDALAFASEVDPGRRDAARKAVEDVLAHHGGLPVARAGGLGRAGTRLVDEVVAAVEAAARRRTALNEDRAPVAAEIRRAVDELGTLPPAEQAAALERLAGLLTEQRTAFEDARYALFGLIAAKNRQARAAAKAERAAAGSARTAAGQRDRGAPARRRKAEADVAMAREAQQRIRRSRDAFLEARRLATEVERAHERLAARLARWSGTPSPADARDLVRPARAVERAVSAYQRALAGARPAEHAIAAGVPTAHLPHLAELTRSVNAQLAAQGSRRRYTEEELDAKLRASFRDVASDEGLLLQEPVVARRSPSGWPRPALAEVRIVLRAHGPAEVARPEVLYGRQASEVMNGALPQGGFSGAGTSVRSGALNVGVSVDAEALSGRLGALVALLAGPTAKVGVGGSRGRTEASASSAGGYALGGGVTDNRGDSLLYETRVTWEVGVRGGSGWAVVDGVSGRSADRGDPARPVAADLMALWVSHAYQARAPPSTTQLPVDRRQQTDLPHHAPISVTGRQELADQTAAAIGEGHGHVGELTRAQVQAFLVDELPGRLGTAVNDPAGLQRTVTDDVGRPLAHLVARAKVQAIPTDDHGRSGLLVGLPTSKEFLEDLRVWFSSVGGSQSSGRSRGLRGSFGVGLRVLTAVAVALFGEAGARFTAGPSGEGGRSWMRSVASSTSEGAIRRALQEQLAPPSPLGCRGVGSSRDGHVTPQLAAAADTARSIETDSTSRLVCSVSSVP